MKREIERIQIDNSLQYDVCIEVKAIGLYVIKIQYEHTATENQLENKEIIRIIGKGKTR